MRNAMLLLLLSLVSRPVTAQVLTLDEALSEAAEQAYAVRIADEGVAQTAQLEDQARSLWRPSVDLSAAYVAAGPEQEIDFGAPLAPVADAFDGLQAANPDLVVPDVGAFRDPLSPIVVRPTHMVQGSVTLTQTLYQPRVAPLLRQARAARAEAEAGRAEAELAVRRAAQDLYFEAVRFQRLRAASERNVELAALQLERAETALREQVGSIFERNRARVSLQRAERDLGQTETGYRVTLDALAEVLDRAPGFEVEAPASLRSTPPLNDLVASAWETRPELERLAAAERRFEAEVDDVRSGGVPVVQAELAGTVQNQTDVADEPFSWQVQIAAQWNLYNGGRRSAERRFQERNATRAALEREERRAAIEGELRRLWHHTEQAERDVEQARAEAELAEENVEVTSAARRAGAASVLDEEAAREQRQLADIALAEAEVRLQALRYRMLLIAGAPA